MTSITNKKYYILSYEIQTESRTEVDAPIPTKCDAPGLKYYIPQEYKKELYIYGWDQTNLIVGVKVNRYGSPWQDVQVKYYIFYKNKNDKNNPQCTRIIFLVVPNTF